MVVHSRDLKLHPGNCSDVYSLVSEPARKWHVVLPELQKLRPT